MMDSENEYNDFNYTNDFDVNKTKIDSLFAMFTTTNLVDLNYNLSGPDEIFDNSTVYIKQYPFDNDVVQPNIYGPNRDSLFIVIPVTIIYSLIFVTGVIGNITTCIVIKKNRSMHTATNYYLFSLAISDFLLLVSGVPQEMYFIWNKYSYIFGEVVCIGRGIVAETSANATVLTITAFTMERYIAICHPFFAQALSKLNRASRIILLIWFISLVAAIPQAAQFGILKSGDVEKCVVVRILINHSFELSTFIFFFAPMSIIFVLYLLIGLKLHQTSVMRKTNGNILYRVNTNAAIMAKNQQGTKRVLKMLVAVVIAFFLCWAPFHAQRLIAIYGVSVTNDPVIEMVYNIMTYISGVLYYLSTCINPLLYNIISKKFREAFKSILFRRHRTPSFTNNYRHPSLKHKSTLSSKAYSDDCEMHSKNQVILKAVLNEKRIVSTTLSNDDDLFQ